MKKVVHFEVHFVILYSKTELLINLSNAFLFNNTNVFTIILFQSH